MNEHWPRLYDQNERNTSVAFLYLLTERISKPKLGSRGNTPIMEANTVENSL